MMLILSQRNLQWGNVTLDQLPMTLARWGCMITCLSMLSSYYSWLESGDLTGRWYKPPDELAKRLEFTKEGLVIWSSVGKHLSFRLENRIRKFDPKAISDSLHDPKKSALLEIDYSHWVVALSKFPFINIYRVADPFHGDKALAGGKFTRYPEITGSANFIS